MRLATVYAPLFKQRAVGDMYPFNQPDLGCVILFCKSFRAGRTNDLDLGDLLSAIASTTYLPRGYRPAVS